MKYSTLNVAWTYQKTETYRFKQDGVCKKIATLNIIEITYRKEPAVKLVATTTLPKNRRLLGKRTKFQVLTLPSLSRHRM